MINESKLKTIGPVYNAFLMIVSVMGMLANLLFMSACYNLRKAEYKDYKYNIKHFGDSYITSLRYFRYNLIDVTIGIMVVFVILYAILAIFKKRKGWFLLSAILMTVSIAPVFILMSDEGVWVGELVRPAVALYGFFILVVATSLLIIATVISRKVFWGFLSMISALGIFAVFFRCFDVYPLESVWAANYFGVAFLATMYEIGVKVAQRPSKNVDAPVQVSTSTSAPAPVPAPVPVPVAGQPVPVSSELSALNSIVVDQKTKRFAFGEAFSIYKEDGTMVGYICQSVSVGQKAAQLIAGRNMRRMQSFDFSICDNSGKRLAGFNRKGIGFINFTDGAGSTIGALKKGKVVNSSEEVVYQLKRNGFRSMSIVDPNGTEIAKLDHKWNGVYNEVFRSKDKYLITFADGVPAATKAICISICVAYDLITT